MVLNGYVTSKVLGTTAGVCVYTPEKAVLETGAYKVVYLLHGLHGNSHFWLNNTMLTSFAGDYGAIFIMPEAGRSFYTNQRHGYDYFTYISEELPFLAQSVFHISAKREDTAVMGCSMGGFGALKAALSKPDRYGFCGAFSSAFLFADKNLDGLRTPAGDVWLAAAPDNVLLLNDLKNTFGADLAYTDDDLMLKLAERGRLHQGSALRCTPPAAYKMGCARKITPMPRKSNASVWITPTKNGKAVTHGNSLAMRSKKPSTAGSKPTEAAESVLLLPYTDEC